MVRKKQWGICSDCVALSGSDLEGLHWKILIRKKGRLVGKEGKYLIPCTPSDNLARLVDINYFIF